MEVIDLGMGVEGDTITQLFAINLIKYLGDIMVPKAE